MFVRKPVIAAALTGALVLPAAALADVIELPVPAPAGTPALTAACPTECEVLSKVTGYQNKTGATKGPMVATKSGRIVAWSVTLAKPNSKQVKYFTEELALGQAEANITVITPAKKLRSRVTQQGPAVKLEKYFGKTVQFPLTRSISIKKGQIVAFTTKTWAPMMAKNQPGTTSWRAAGRPKSKCTDQATFAQDFSQTQLNKTVQYACIYRNAQLLYGVTIVSNPPPDNTKD